VEILELGTKQSHLTAEGLAKIQSLKTNMNKWD